MTYATCPKRCPALDCRKSGVSEFGFACCVEHQEALQKFADAEFRVYGSIVAQVGDQRSPKEPYASQARVMFPFVRRSFQLGQQEFAEKEMLELKQGLLDSRLKRLNEFADSPAVQSVVETELLASHKLVVVTAPKKRHREVCLGSTNNDVDDDDKEIEAELDDISDLSHWGEHKIVEYFKAGIIRVCRDNYYTDEDAAVMFALFDKIYPKGHDLWERWKARDDYATLEPMVD